MPSRLQRHYSGVAPRHHANGESNGFFLQKCIRWTTDHGYNI